MPLQPHPAALNSCIIMPLQPMTGRTHDGVGVALHFLMGNVMALHSTLKELWFGWRVKQIFEDAAHLSAYCCGERQIASLEDLGRQEEIRFWVHGQYDHQTARVSVYDADRNQPTEYKDLPYFSDTSKLIKFRRFFFSLLDQAGLAFPESQKKYALWDENISSAGLSAVGHALEYFYRCSAFNSKNQMDLTLFEVAVEQAPKAFIAHDLTGWAQYRNQDYPKAISAFQRALTINPYGVGAMTGLMLCGAHMKDWKETRSWAVRKASVCNKNELQAEQNARRIFEKYI